MSATGDALLKIAPEVWTHCYPSSAHGCPTCWPSASGGQRVASDWCEVVEVWKEAHA